MKSGPKGFSLLEVMIALAFIGVALVAVIRAQGQGIRLGDEARFTSRAVMLARQVLAEAQAEAEVQPGRSQDDFEEPLEDFSWEKEVTPVTGFDGLYKIQVWVYREDRPAREGITLQGFVFRGTL